MSSRTGCPAALVAIALLALLPAPALATPVVDLSWDSCSPIQNAKSLVPGQATLSLFCSVTGMTERHKAYQANVFLAGNLPCRSAATPVPDAWRFDPPGCQGASLGNISFQSTNKACPPFSGPELPQLSITAFDFSEPPVGQYDGPAGSLRVVVAATYPDRIQTPDPGVRYLLFRVDFDHTYSVVGAGTPGETCGGLETPSCASLFTGYAYTIMGECGLGLAPSVSYLDPEGIEWGMNLGEGYASFGVEPGMAFHCFEVVPARATTWGAIKAQYR